MSENLLASVTADVMLYEDNSKQWVRPGENGLMATISHSGLPDVQKLSNIQLWQSQNKTAFKITAKRIFDGKLLIEQTLFQKLKYQAATKCFHQWRSESRQVFGLSFSCEQDAEKFLVMVQQAMEYLSSINDFYFPTQNGNGNSNNNNINNNNNNNINSINSKNNNNAHYQESWYQQQQKQSNCCKEPDQDSIGSASGINSTYRKSSYSVNVTNNFCSSVSGIIQPQQQQQQQYSHYSQQSQQFQQQQHMNNNIQRRASQSSNHSASTNSSGTNNAVVAMGNGIYAQANGTNDYYSNTMSRLNINGLQPNQHLNNLNSNIQSQNSLLTDTATSSSSTCSTSNITLTTYASLSIPPIATNVPPPPPPPPPSLKANNGNKSVSLVDQLQQKQMQLRSVTSNGVSSTIGNVINRTSSLSADTGIGSKNSTINSTNSAHSDLFSELAATINKRKLANGLSASEERKTESIVEKRETAPFIRPWQKPNNAGVASASNNVVNDSPKVHRKAASGSSLSSQEEQTVKNGNATNNFPSSTALTSSSSVTLNDLDRLKQELILEFNKAKEDILNAVRQELAQYFQLK